MRRSVGWVVVLAWWCGGAGADNASRLPLSDQAQLLRRNRALVQVTVSGSLELADLNNALDRVESCQRMVRVWLREVEAAARSGDVPRALEMGEHLNKVADRGVALNLRVARNHIPPSTPDERRLLQRRDDAVRDLEQLEAVLAELSRSDGDLRAVLGRLQAVRRLVAAATDLPKS